MSIRNNLLEGSAVLDPEGFLSNRDDAISLEDQAWADSCFVGDSEILDSDWDSFRNALQKVDTTRWVHIPVSETDHLASPKVGRTDNIASSDDVEENEEDGNSDMILDNNIKSKSKKTNGVYPFRPNYNEHLQDNEKSDLSLDLDFFDFSSDTVTEDIFKVWDLDIPAEEDDELITKQLTPENSTEKLPANSNGLEAWKDLKDGSLDDLITGISDLSLDLKSN